jgi:competence protein ComEA
LAYLTKQERLVLIFLAAALTAGAAVKVLRGERAPPPPKPLEVEFDLATPKAPADAAALADITAPRKINVNTATAAALCELPGIGPYLAARIIAYRDAHGPFEKAEDLDAVEGIGPATVEKLEPHVTCETPE